MEIFGNFLTAKSEEDARDQKWRGGTGLVLKLDGRTTSHDQRVWKPAIRQIWKSALRVPAAFDLGEEPGFSVGPVVVGGAGGDVHGLGGFFKSHADEVSQLDELGLGAVLEGEYVQGVVDFEDFVVVARSGDFQLIELDVFRAGAVADGAFAASFVDEDAANGLGGGGEKMGAIGKFGIVRADEAKPGFVDERGGLEGLIGGLPGHFCGGQFAQFVIDQRQKLVGGGRIAVRNSFKNACDVAQRSNDRIKKEKGKRKKGGQRSNAERGMNLFV